MLVLLLLSILVSRTAVAVHGCPGHRSLLQLEYSSDLDQLDYSLRLDRFFGVRLRGGGTCLSTVTNSQDSKTMNSRLMRAAKTGSLKAVYTYVSFPMAKYKHLRVTFRSRTWSKMAPTSTFKTKSTALLCSELQVLIRRLLPDSWLCCGISPSPCLPRGCAPPRSPRRNDSQPTAAAVAAEHGNTDAVELLVRLGADRRHLDKFAAHLSTSPVPINTLPAETSRRRSPCPDHRGSSRACTDVVSGDFAVIL
jgi:hypothetical protein